jgi:hypothetical protein
LTTICGNADKFDVHEEPMFEKWLTQRNTMRCAAGGDCQTGLAAAGVPAENRPNLNATDDVVSVPAASRSENRWICGDLLFQFAGQRFEFGLAPRFVVMTILHCTRPK